MKIREKNNFILIGFMASGKTTLSKELEMLGFTRLSTDEMIIEKMQMSISDIFSNYGEEYFRKLEEETIYSVIEILKDTSEKYVIDCGGGLIRANNFSELKKYGEVCFLNVAFEEVVNRLKYDNTRPLARDKEKLCKLYIARLEEYKNIADFEYNGAGLEDFIITLNLE